MQSRHTQGIGHTNTVPDGFLPETAPYRSGETIVWEKRLPNTQNRRGFQEAGRIFPWSPGRTTGLSGNTGKRACQRATYSITIIIIIVGDQFSPPRPFPVIKAPYIGTAAPRERIFSLYRGNKIHLIYN
jgi:hypothetical protein